MVQFTTSDATVSQLLANYMFTATDNGVHTFAAAAALFTAGRQTVKARAAQPNLGANQVV